MIQIPPRLRAVVGSARAVALLSSGLAAGLFVAHLAAEVMPDGIANTVCMFAFGCMAGLLVGLTHSPRHSGPVSTPRKRI